MPKITTRTAIQAVGALVVIMLAFWLANFAQESDAVRRIVSNYGYFGIFFISLVSGFNLLVPIPAVAFLPLFLESGLPFGSTVAVITLGMTCADGLAYMIARTGRQLISESAGEKIFLKLNNLHDKHPHLPLVILFFFASFAPLPNEVLLIPLVFLGYRLRQVMPIVFAGNVIFTLVYAQGVLGLFKLF